MLLASGVFCKVISEDKREPLCVVLSEQGVQLLFFPYENEDNDCLVECIALPAIPLLSVAATVALTGWNADVGRLLPSGTPKREIHLCVKNKMKGLKQN